MNAFPAIVRVRIESGSPVQIGGLKVIPQSRVLVVRLPFAAYVRHRPVAVLVERDGQRERIPIPDRTRMLQLGMLGAGLLVSLATRCYFSPKQRAPLRRRSNVAL